MTNRTAAFFAAAILVIFCPFTAHAQVCEPTELGNASSSVPLGDLVLSGSTVYCAAGPSGISWFDTSNPAAPVAGGTMSTGGSASDLLLDYFANKLVVANGSGGLAIYAVAGASLTLSSSGTLGLPVVSVGGSASQPTVGTQTGSLMTVNFDQDVPQVQGSVDLGGPVVALEVYQSFALCAVSSVGLVVVDLHDRTQPEIVQTLALGGGATALALDSDRLLVGTGGGQMVLYKVHVTAGYGETQTTIDLSDAGVLPLPGVPSGILAWAGRAYVSIPDTGVVAVDESLGTGLLQIGTVDLLGADGMELAGDTLFVARGTRGLSSLDVSSCSQSSILPTTTYIPAGAKATGSENTFWVTDMAMLNLTANPAVCNLSYLVKNQANPLPDTVTVVLGPGEQTLYGDVFNSLFGLSSANGAIKIVASHPDVRVTSRTYNAAGANGTYGQFIPAQDDNESCQAGRPVSLAQLQQNQAFRTNIGLLNLSSEEVPVEIDLYLGTGNLAATVPVTLEPFEMVQRDQIFSSAGVGTVNNGYAVVRVTSGEGSVIAYASVIDQESGDPIYVPAKRMLPGTPFE